MNKFLSLEVGDKVTREMKGFSKSQNWENEGSVTEIRANIIVCKILVDTYRTMTFDRNTGINLLGKDYGWLKVV